jgi:hypothetical protein
LTSASKQIKIKQFTNSKKRAINNSALQYGSFEQILDQQKELDDDQRKREVIEEIDPREITRQVLKTCNILRERNATV